MSSASPAESVRSLEDVQASQRPPRRTLLARLARDVISRWGARLGLAWIGVTAFFAVVGPLIASSHPYIMKTSGGWSSPMLLHLAPVDVILLLGALWSLIVLAVRSLAVPQRVLICILGWWFISAATWYGHASGEYVRLVYQVGLGLIYLSYLVLAVVLVLVPAITEMGPRRRTLLFMSQGILQEMN